MENNIKDDSKNEGKKNNISILNSNILKKGFVWRPVPTILSTTLCFLISGIIFIVIGAVLLYLTSQINDFVQRYDNIPECDTALRTTNGSHNCTYEFSLQTTLDPPVMFYYQLDNFYQDHRRYIKSKSVNQLAGQVLSASDISSDCDPIIYVSDLGINTTLGNKVVLNATDVANPCGLMARSFFNDSFLLLDDSNTSIYINETGIAWPSDLKGRYVHPPNYLDIQWRNVTDEHFMVWMRPAGLPDFRKLWGRINQTLPAGKYIINIDNRFPVYPFNGKKSFVLSTVNILGGRNSFLGIAYLVVGCVCLIMAFLFWVGYKHYNNERKLN